MNITNYSERVQGFIQSAHGLAQRRNHQQLMPEHLLKVILDDPDGLAARLIRAAAGDPAVATMAVEAVLDKLPRVSGGQFSLAHDTSRLFKRAEDIAQKAGDSYVTVERLLIALALDTATPAGEILKDAGISVEALNRAINDLRKGRTAQSVRAEDGYDALNKYARDLTAMAQDGKLDPVIGREEEIRRTVQVLSRRTKNNPVLIGAPGVGKTAIIEGLALRIVNGDVPENLLNKRLMALDLAGMVAGAKYRGDFEERLKSLLAEITAADGEVILFIDELHSLVGAGQSDGAMDASNMLKPALARGELHCVGATTLDEYRLYVEKDAALARRFQPVVVAEPTVEDSISILRGLKEKYELHHGVRITDAAIVASATLSDRYITDRFLPDKAIDLMDEAASRLRMQVSSKPEDLDELDRRLVQLKIEQSALSREDDPAARERLAALEAEIVTLEERSVALTAQWESARHQRAERHKVKEDLDQARIALEQAERAGALDQAGELKYSTIPALEKSLLVSGDDTDHAVLSEDVSAESIAAVVSRWTGIPIDKMLEGEREKLLKMESELGRRVIGQRAAITAISNAVRRSRAGLQDPSRPLGSFLFLGPTGVGKTELTKALAAFLFDDDTAMVRLDMSEFMEKHSVARLIGAPPGYVGYEQGGALTEAVRRRPYQVVLFDEIEKAHPDVFHLLLQVLDDGRLTDGQGRTVDFRHTLILLTSNLGAEILAQQPQDAVAPRAEQVKKDSTALRAEVMAVVGATFRPEFINRLDDVLLFHRLGRDDMSHIVNIQLDHLRTRLKAQGFALTVTAQAVDWLAEQGYDPVFGARPLRRLIQTALQDRLASLILAGQLGQELVVDVGPDGLVIEEGDALP